MHSLEHLARTPSRRTVLQSGMAGAFVLGFHLPARAVNEPEQLPDSTQGKFAPNAFIRIDGSGQTTLVMPQVEMGQGVYTPMISPTSWTQISARSCCNMPLPTRSSTPIQPSAFRLLAIPIPFARSGNRCAWRALQHG